MEEKQPSFSTEELKFIVPRFLAKLTRFLFLAQIYNSYWILDCFPGINFHGFTQIYVYLWAIVSLLVGIVLFMFGKATLLQDDINYLLRSTRIGHFDKLCDGTVYRYLNILLCFLFPALTVTKLHCYTDFVKIPHSMFMATLCALVLASEMMKKRRILWSLLFLVVIVNVSLCTFVGNFWGVVGSLFIMFSASIAIDPRGDKLSARVYPICQVVGTFGSTAALTWSFRHMSSEVDGLNQDVPVISKSDLCEQFSVFCK